VSRGVQSGANLGSARTGIFRDVWQHHGNGPNAIKKADLTAVLDKYPLQRFKYGKKK